MLILDLIQVQQNSEMNEGNVMEKPHINLPIAFFNYLMLIW